MRRNKIKGVWHYIYEDDSEIPPGIVIKEDWKSSEKGDWVRADDGNVIQILRKGQVKHYIKGNQDYLGTCTGTFLPEYQEMDTEKREDIYSFSGKPRQARKDGDNRLSSWEEQFVHLVAGGVKPVDAYLQVYPTNKRSYASVQSSAIMKTERIKKAMKKELEPVLEELGISERFVLEKVKQMAELADKDDTKLRALFKLADIMDMEDKTATKTQMITGTIFKGFEDGTLAEAQRPLEIQGKNDEQG